MSLDSGSPKALENNDDNSQTSGTVCTWESVAREAFNVRTNESRRRISISEYKERQKADGAMTEVPNNSMVPYQAPSNNQLAVPPVIQAPPNPPIPMGGQPMPPNSLDEYYNQMYHQRSAPQNITHNVTNNYHAAVHINNTYVYNTYALSQENNHTGALYPQFPTNATPMPANMPSGFNPTAFTPSECPKTPTADDLFNNEKSPNTSRQSSNDKGPKLTPASELNDKEQCNNYREWKRRRSESCDNLSAGDQPNGKFRKTEWNKGDPRTRRDNNRNGRNNDNSPASDSWDDGPGSQSKRGGSEDWGNSNNQSDSWQNTRRNSSSGNDNWGNNNRKDNWGNNNRNDNRGNNNTNDNWGNNNRNDNRRNNNTDDNWGNNNKNDNRRNNNTDDNWGNNNRSNNRGNNNRNDSWGNNNRKDNWGNNNRNDNWGNNNRNDNRRNNNRNDSWGNDNKNDSWGNKNKSDDWENNNGNSNWGNRNGGNRWGNKDGGNGGGNDDGGNDWGNKDRGNGWRNNSGGGRGRGRGRGGYGGRRNDGDGSGSESRQFGQNNSGNGYGGRGRQNSYGRRNQWGGGDKSESGQSWGNRNDSANGGSDSWNTAGNDSTSTQSASLPAVSLDSWDSEPTPQPATSAAAVPTAGEPDPLATVTLDSWGDDPAPQMVATEPIAEAPLIATTLDSWDTEPIAESAIIEEPAATWDVQTEEVIGETEDLSWDQPSTSGELKYPAPITDWDESQQPDDWNSETVPIAQTTEVEPGEIIDEVQPAGTEFALVNTFSLQEAEQTSETILDNNLKDESDQRMEIRALCTTCSYQLTHQCKTNLIMPTCNPMELKPGELFKCSCSLIFLHESNCIERMDQAYAPENSENVLLKQVGRSHTYVCDQCTFSFTLDNIRDPSHFFTQLTTKKGNKLRGSVTIKDPKGIEIFTNYVENMGNFLCVDQSQAAKKQQVKQRMSRICQCNRGCCTIFHECSIYKNCDKH